MSKQTETIELTVGLRDEVGSGHSRRLRRAGSLPGIVYGGDGAPRPIKLNRHEMELLLKKTGGGHNLILDLVAPGMEKKKVLLREVQRDHIRDYPTHVDFMEISMTKKLRVSVEIILKGDPVGVTQTGGVMEHLLRHIEVECLPADMIHEVEIDVSSLQIGDSLSVKDLNIDKSKITVLTPGDIAIVAVLLPRVEEEKKPEETEAAATEPERIGEKKEGEEEAAGEEEDGQKAKKDAKETKETKEKTAKPEKGEKPEKK